MSPRRLSLGDAALFALALLFALVFATHAFLVTDRAHAARPRPTLRVFAAASLAEAFKELSGEFERAHAGTAIQFNLAGSQQLAAQLEQGAVADVFASADQRWMDFAKEHELLAGEAQVFAHNRLVVIVPRTNHGRISSLQNLTRRGLKIVIGAEAVPVGRYSREMLQKLGRAPGFAPDYAARVLANVVSEEENVKAVVGKVQLGEADAGVVYRSDITPALERYVRTLEVPESASVVASYPIAVLRSSPLPDAARDFIALVLSPAGQRILRKRGLVPVEARAH